MKHTIKHTPMQMSMQIDITLENVEQMYEGKGNCCRCGCGGNYYYPDHNARKIENVLKRMASGKYKVESIDNYIFEIIIDEDTDRFGQPKTKVQTIYIKK
jgi:hypothetical protein